MPIIAIGTKDTEFEKTCQKLAKQYSLPLFTESVDTKYLLLLDANGLSLHCLQNQKLKPLQMNFSQGKTAYRASHAHKELLAKAIAIHKNPKPKVFDATAGFGKDGFLLAKMGCRVTMIERNPVLFLLLQDALKRFQDNADKKLSLELFHQDAKQCLKQQNLKADIIYLDPMFPERKKSALVKKEMQILQDLIGHEPDDIEVLLHMALSAASKRVIVKRPINAPFLAGLAPSFSYSGKAIRFDVYLKSGRIS